MTPPAAIVPTAPTNWSHSVQVQQFDPSQGTLNGIDFSLTGTVQGSIGIESLDAEASAVTAGVGADVSLNAPVFGNVLSTYANAQKTVNLAAFDGTIDYAGPSGMTFTGLSASSTVQTGYPVGHGGKSVAPYIGKGNVALGVKAIGYGTISAPLNVATRFQDAAGASASVTYDYSVPANGGGSAGVGSQTDTISLPPPIIIGARHTPLQTVTLSDQRTSWTRGITFNQFNPALGTLYSADFVLNGDFATSLSVQNTGSSGATYDAQQGVTFDLRGPDGAMLGDTLTGTRDLSGDVASGATVDRSSLDTVSETFSVFDPDELALLTGIDTVDLSVDAIGSLFATLPGNSLMQSLGLAGATISLSYTYVPSALALAADSVPEPGTLGLFASGLVVLGLTIRRRIV